MKAIDAFVSKCSHDGHELIGKFPSLKKVIFTSSEYPVDIVLNFAQGRKERIQYSDSGQQLVLPISVCNGKVIIQILSEKCLPRTTYQPVESE